MEQRTTSSLLFKVVDFNSMYNMLNLRDDKKRKTGGVSTLREKPIKNEVDSAEFWDNLIIEEEALV